MEKKDLMDILHLNPETNINCEIKYWLLHKLPSNKKAPGWELFFNHIAIADSLTFFIRIGFF